MNTANTSLPGDASPPAEARAPLSAAGIFWYSLANLGYGAFYAFNNFIIPLWLHSFTADARILGLMGGSHSFEGAIIQPIVGSISDRLHGPGGRRRPFMRVFIVLSALFLLLAPTAAHLPLTLRLGGVVGCIFLFTLTFNVAMDPYQALLADITTTEQRGRVTGLWYFVGTVGQVAILALVALMHLPLGLAFPIVGLLMLATTLLTCTRTREPATLPAAETKRGHRDDLLLALRGLRTLLRQARLYMAYVLCCTGRGSGRGDPYPHPLYQRRITVHCSDSVGAADVGAAAGLHSELSAACCSARWSSLRRPKRLLLISMAFGRRSPR